MNVTVSHKNGEIYEMVAKVTIPSSITVETEALEYAYSLTQNSSGSWSKELDDDNADWNDNVEVLKDMTNEQYGLRCTMVGDIIVLNGKPFNVVGFGFEILGL